MSNHIILSVHLTVRMPMEVARLLTNTCPKEFRQNLADILRLTPNLTTDELQTLVRTLEGRNACHDLPENRIATCNVCRQNWYETHCSAKDPAIRLSCTKCNWTTLA